jgi:uncharacterized protein YsxB (DUF464 family)
MTRKNIIIICIAATIVIIGAIVTIKVFADQKAKKDADQSNIVTTKKENTGTNIDSTVIREKSNSVNASDKPYDY